MHKRAIFHELLHTKKGKILKKMLFHTCIELYWLANLRFAVLEKQIMKTN